MRRGRLLRIPGWSLPRMSRLLRPYHVFRCFSLTADVATTVEMPVMDARLLVTVEFDLEGPVYSPRAVAPAA